MSRYPGAIGMKRAKSQGMWLWHKLDGGRLYETSDRFYYFCASCDVSADREPYVQGLDVTATWTNKSPGPATDEHFWHQVDDVLVKCNRSGPTTSRVASLHFDDKDHVIGVTISYGDQLLTFNRTRKEARP